MPHFLLVRRYKMHRANERSGFPTVITIFSAPNYCGEFDNAGAMMSVDETLMCSFHILKPATAMESLSPINDRRPTGLMGGSGARRPATPMPPPGKR